MWHRPPRRGGTPSRRRSADHGPPGRVGTARAPGAGYASVSATAHAHRGFPPAFRRNNSRPSVVHLGGIKALARSRRGQATLSSPLWAYDRLFPRPLINQGPASSRNRGTPYSRWTPGIQETAINETSGERFTARASLQRGPLGSGPVFRPHISGRCADHPQGWRRRFSVRVPLSGQEFPARRAVCVWRKRADPVSAKQ